MLSAVVSPPAPANEPVLTYAPGTPERAELKSNCRVVGDIRAPRVLIADGASFKGSVDMDA